MEIVDLDAGSSHICNVEYPIAVDEATSGLMLGAQGLIEYPPHMRPCDIELFC